MATSSFEKRLIDALQPVRYFGLATCIYHLFETGLFDTLFTSGGLSLGTLVIQSEMDRYKLETFLRYLQVEGIIEENDDTFCLTDQGKNLAEFRPWYTLFIGGYSETFFQIGGKLRQGAGWAPRDLTRVGIGSCGISHFDAIPLTRLLMQNLPSGYCHMLDLGCGNGLYLIEFCKALPEIKAWGVEPDEGSYRQALDLVHKHGLEDRVRLTHNSASEFLQSELDYEPDFVVLGFVLHEILGQEGEEGVIRFLKGLSDRFPKLYFIVIEVDLQIDNPRIMHHGLATAYYNPYYLLHPFTRQRLEKQAFWEYIFARSQLEILKKEAPPTNVDSTGLEIGYLLKSRLD